MTKAELIEKIARSRELPPDVTKKCIGQILDLAFDELGTYFVRAKVTRSQCPRFTFPGFGTFTKKKRSARNGVNPRTLEPMTIEAAYTIDFRPGTDLRQNLNAKVAVASAVKGKRRAGAAQLGQLEMDPVDPAGLSVVPAAHAVAAVLDEDDDDSVPIHRRRFTDRDDLEDDLEEALTEELGDVVEAGYQLDPAPMQRARLRGAASTPRTGS
ncbi:MAG: HU family DNA-binding protein [Nannocystis sp.]|nr:HU family DNA-binding protein [Nannocystis sp.]MBA3545638.1 HU family DNA-binding protein [Nannocystis sp.]